jgi:hypothetical protein
MKKIKITPEQETAFKEYVRVSNKFDQRPLNNFIYAHKNWNGNYKSLKDLTPEQFAFLLCGHYEVEEDRTSWEYFKRIIDGYIFSKNRLIGDINNLYYSKATKEEYIGQENKNSFKRYGRSYGEFKIGDHLVLEMQIYSFTLCDNEDIVAAEKYFKKGEVKYIHFVEDRKELLS